MRLRLGDKTEEGETGIHDPHALVRHIDEMGRGINATALLKTCVLLVMIVDLNLTAAHRQKMKLLLATVERRQTLPRPALLGACVQVPQTSTADHEIRCRHKGYLLTTARACTRSKISQFPLGRRSQVRRLSAAQWTFPQDREDVAEAAELLVAISASQTKSPLLLLCLHQTQIVLRSSLVTVVGLLKPPRHIHHQYQCLPLRPTRLKPPGSTQAGSHKFNHPCKPTCRQVQQTSLPRQLHLAHVDLDRHQVESFLLPRQLAEILRLDR